ncbi:DUF3857 domain-containing protein [Altererythrobacter sp. CAU 1778]
MLYLRANNYVAHIHSGGQQSYFDQTVRILTSQALQAGNIALRWNPAAGKPVIHALQITRDGTVIDVLKSTEFQILRREEQLETAMLDGLLTATLKVPDLRVGDDLTLAYSLPASDPTLRDVSYGLLYILDVPPPPARFGSRSIGKTATLRPSRLRRPCRLRSCRMPIRWPSNSSIRPSCAYRKERRPATAGRG